MLTRNGDRARVKVLDFGLAKATREEKIDVAITSPSQAVGTPDFIAPEQVFDAPNVDTRADIYSLGGTLYYLLTGQPPFRANSLYDLYQAHISRDAEPLNLVRPDVPSEPAALVAKMMAKVPGERFQTPGEAAHALKVFFKPTEASLTGDRTDLLSQEWPERFRSDRSWLVSKPSNPDERALPDSIREDPIEFDETEPPVDAAGANASPKPGCRNRRESTVLRRSLRARPGRTVWATGGVLLLGLAVALAALVLKVRTPSGMIVLENVPVQSSVPEPITPAADSEGWVPLFNGRDKTNWVEGRGNHGHWKVVDGVLEGHGGDAAGQPAVLLTTRSDYTNFRLRARILNEGQRKRIKVRMRANADMTHTTDGYGVRVGGTRSAIGDEIPLGSINDDEKRLRKDRIDWAVVAEAVHVELGDWYTLEISAIGNRMTTSVNGTKVAEFADETNPFLAGRIALICRARDTIRFKEISIKELPDDPVQEMPPEATSKTKEP
jgi:hypothetical protein